MMKKTESINLEPDFTQNGFYTVQNGDTIRKIAEKIFGNAEDYRKIMELNGLSDTNIFAGQILRIPENFNSNIISYRVKSGDTLWSIAQSFLGYGPRYNEIMSLNGMTTDMIYPGQILKISIDKAVAPKTYMVKSGDTLWKIARENLGDGKRYTDIMMLNNLDDTDIRVGQKLNLPNE